jgi:hypothetical protein
MQDLREEAAAHRFTAMHWHYRTSPVGMLEKMMAALDADHLKSQLSQDLDQLRAGD